MKKPVRVSYVHCVECGLLVRLAEVDVVPKDAPPGIYFGGACPNCKVRVALTFAPPEELKIVPVIPNLSLT